MRKQNAFTLIELLVVIAIIAILAAILFPVFAQAREKARAISCLSNEKQMGIAFQMYAQDYDEAYPFWNYALFAPAGWQETSADEWDAKLLPYVKNGHPEIVSPDAHDYSGVWHCPDGEDGTKFRTYGLSYTFLLAYHSSTPHSTIRTLLTLPQIETPAHFIVVGETGRDRGTDFGDGVNSNDGNGGLMDPSYLFEGYAEHNHLTYNGGALDRERPYRHSGGANYVFSDTHAKFLKAEIPFPHPPVPTLPDNASSGDLGQARCAFANWMCPTSEDQQYQVSKAVSLGVPCTINN